MRPERLEIFKVVVSAVILLASFATGLRAAKVDPFWLLKRPSLLLRSLLAILVLVPVATVAFLQAIDAPRVVEAGLIVIVLAVGIGPPAAFKQTQAADANVDYEVELNVILLSLAILFIPTAVAVLGTYFHVALRLEPSRVAMVVLTRALIPLLLGVLVARLAPKVSTRLGRIAAPIVQVALLAVVAVALVATWRSLLGLGGYAWLICAAVGLGALAIGHLCGGPDPTQRRVLATFSSMRFPALALLVASIAPVGRQAIPVILAYVLCSAVLVALYRTAMSVWGRRRIGHAIPAVPTPERA